VSSRDIVGLVLSYVYAFGLLFAVEALGRRFRWQQAFTRKVIHIAAGMWVWGILALFEHWYAGIIPFATFVVLNYAFYRRQAFEAMDTAESTPGTVYFALSISLLFALLWRTGDVPDRVPVAAAAVMAMTLGDAAASLVGQRWGRHTYRSLGHTRSWEGTTAMGVVSLLAIGLTLLLLPGSALSPSSIPWTTWGAIVIAACGTVVATAAEALSPAGTDNLTVPLLSALAMYLVGSVTSFAAGRP
jgi:phytol kinase